MGVETMNMFELKAFGDDDEWDDDSDFDDDSD